MSKYIRRLMGLALVIVAYTLTICIAPVMAITKEDMRSLTQNAPFYDPSSGNGCAVNGATIQSRVGGGLDAASSVYILGDSITVGAAEAYSKVFSTKSITAVVDGSTSRSINGAGTDGNKLSGLQAVEEDQSDIIVAKVIIVGLGTNGGNTAESMKALHTAIRNYNSSAPIYWLDTTAIGRPSYIPTIAAANRAIYNNTDLGYKVISWYKAVTPDGDPENPTGKESDINGLINAEDGYGVHPSNPGKEALANLVLNTITNSVTANPTTGTSCFSSVTSLPGDNNAEIVFNFLVSKGLTPIQAAGIMGNLQAESHFESRLVQYGQVNCRGEISVAREPSSLCDLIVVNGQSGYGLAQWTTSGRQQALHDFAVSRGTTDGDLTTQLEFLWKEMTTTFNSSVLTPLKATNDLTVATDIVLKKFECPRACVNVINDPSTANQTAYQNVLNDRKALAQALLTQFGSSGGL